MDVRRAASLFLLVMVAGVTATALFRLTVSRLGVELSGTVVLGIGVAIAVYADCRWLVGRPAPGREALEYGAATAVGWAAAQALVVLW